MFRLSCLLLLLSTLAFADPIEECFRFQGSPVDVSIYLPQGYTKGDRPPVLVTLPPGPGNADMVKANLSNYWLAEGLKRGYIVVAPEIFGRSLEKNAGMFVERLFNRLSNNATYDKQRVYLTGQSNGGIGSFYLAVARPHRFKKILVVPGQYLGPAKNLSKLKGKPILMLVGEKDEPTRWLEPVRETAKTLEKYGAKVQLKELTGQGHVPRVRPAQLFDWLEKR